MQAPHMSPLPCPDLHPALLQSIPALQLVETTVSKFINKEWASEASPTPCNNIIIIIRSDPYHTSTDVVNILMESLKHNACMTIMLLCEVILKPLVIMLVQYEK